MDSEEINKFEVAYQKYVQDVYRVCLYLSRDEKQAEEITLQVFANLYEIIDSIDDKYIRVCLIHKAKALAKKYEDKEASK